MRASTFWTFILLISVGLVVSVSAAPTEFLALEYYNGQNCTGVVDAIDFIVVGAEYLPNVPNCLSAIESVGSCLPHEPTGGYRKTYCSSTLTPTLPIGAFGDFATINVYANNSCATDQLIAVLLNRQGICLPLFKPPHSRGGNGYGEYSQISIFQSHAHVSRQISPLSNSISPLLIQEWATVPTPTRTFTATPTPPAPKE